MRIQREFFKPRRESVYLHVYNHTVSSGYEPYPLGDFEKNKFIEIAERYLPKYNIEIISLVLMGNHFHALLHCSHERLNPQEACKAYNKFHKGKPPVEQDHYRVKNLTMHSNNFSEYMREVQREFTVWFNKSRPYKRKGALWQDRFQCQLIESDLYMWTCLKYIEMNPVRAGICSNPEDYNFSSYGRWKEKHPYQEDFLKYILRIMNKSAGMKEIKAFMQSQMQKMKNLDRAAKLHKQGRLKEATKMLEKSRLESLENETIIFTFATKDWTSGKVIGSKEFERQKYREWLMYRNTG